MARRTFTDESLATLVDETKAYADSASSHSNKTILDNITASYTTAEQTKLAGIATGAEVNQSAFSNIKVGSTTVAADTKTDTVEFAGSNVTITPDATNDKITFTVANGTTATKGIVQLTDSTSSASTTTAATPNSVKSAYDLANTAKTNAANAQTAAENAQATADEAADNSVVSLGTSGNTITYTKGDGSTSSVTAPYASKAASATSATYATTATNASSATYSSNSAKATSATSATYATTATKAGTATYATNSGTSTYATNAGSASKAASATSATYSTNAVSASTAINAVNADTATYAVNSGTAAYAKNAGTAVRATNADTATYAINSGTSTYSTNSAKATTASKAGTATYAKNAGTAATLTGLTASVTELNYVDGVTSSIQTQLDNNYSKVISKGEQLVVNGNAIIGDNTNFSAWTYDGAVANNSPGSFTIAQGTKKTMVTDEYFPVNTNNEYTFSFDVKSSYGLARLYSMIVFYDADKLEVKSPYFIYNAGSTTTLAKELKAGDTVIYLTDSSGWSTTFSYGFYLTVWNYTNSFGYTYPAETYSRNRVTLPKTSSNTLDGAYLDQTAHTITLTTAYNDVTIPAGTPVSQGGDGGTYKYFPITNKLIPTSWTSYSGKISGVDYSGGNVSNMFPPGTAYARVGFLWNYNTADDQLWLTNVVVTDTTASSNALSVAEAASDNSIVELGTSGNTITYKKGNGTTSSITAPYATNAGTATYSSNGAKATSATSATYASTATKAGTATYATNSGTAAYSSNGAKATSATSATYATTATKAGTATYSTNSGTATYATNSGTAAYSSNGAKATSATSATYATTATKAGTATYATNASTSAYSSNSAKATSATSATYATTASKAGTATYATNAGTATYASSASTATRSIYDQNGYQIDRMYSGAVPQGTLIPANADLNTTTYLAVGNYYCNQNATVATFTNCPTELAFMMQVYSPLATAIDNETTGTWVYRLRKITTHKGVEYFQAVNSGATAGTFTYGDWVQTIKTGDTASKATSATSATYATNAGTATYATNASTSTYASSATTATYLKASTGISRNFYVYDANNVKAGSFYSNTAGTTANTGNAYLMIGNGSASSVAGNARGYLRLYDATTAYTQITTSGGNTANRTIVIPNASSTMALMSHLGRSNACSAANTSYTTYMARGIAASTASMTAGSSSLTNGCIYLQYE